ncbi:MAG: hypothetical protein HXY51_02075, partial [Nitrospirae bacterium]|nr:hypothetical protein [Nitrospirota bacterium]
AHDGVKEIQARIEEPEGRAKPVLYLLAFLLEVWIGNDVPTFQTAYLAGFVLYFGDTIGDHSAVGTGA